MDIEQSQPARDVPQRDRLPNRRASQNISFEQNNLNYQMTVGLYADGRVGEIFLNAEHGNSFVDAIAHDAAILASIAQAEIRARELGLLNDDGGET